MLDHAVNDRIVTGPAAISTRAGSRPAPANPERASPKLVVAHDYVTQRGGAERVVLDLLRSFPGSRLVTACYNPATTYPRFAKYDIETLWPNRFGLFRRDPRSAFPVLARAFSRHFIDDADLVICSTSGWAHRVSASAPKIVYCHNPARWLYQPDDYFGDLPRWAAWAQGGFVAAMGGLKESDLLAAQQCSRYLCNSAAVGERVRDTYGIESSVIPPSRGISPGGLHKPVEGVEPGYLLTVGRRRRYKNTDSVCTAVASIPGERLIAVGGPSVGPEVPGITRLTGLSDENMRWLYANASGLVAVAHEDFGLAPVEAQAFGVPSVVLRAGGYLDTTVENVTGVFVDGTAPELIAAAIRELRSRVWDPAEIRRCAERFSREAFTRRITRIVDEELGLDRTVTTNASIPAVDPANEFPPTRKVDSAIHAESLR